MMGDPTFYSDIHVSFWGGLNTVGKSSTDTPDEDGRGVLFKVM